MNFTDFKKVIKKVKKEASTNHSIIIDEFEKSADKKENDSQKAWLFMLRYAKLKNTYRVYEKAK